jgi:hypothetical protein
MLQLSDITLRLFYNVINLHILSIWLQLASKGEIYVITKALNIWPPRDLG